MGLTGSVGRAGAKRWVVAMTAACLVVSGAGVAVSQLVPAPAPVVRPATPGTPVAADLDGLEPMKRPEGFAGTKLADPKSAEVDQGLEQAPLKATKSCSEAKLEAGAAGSRDGSLMGLVSGSTVCQLSETRQSPELLDADRLVLDEDAKAAPVPAPQPDPQPEASATPSAEASPTGEPTTPAPGAGSPSPSGAAPTPSETPTAPVESGAPSGGVDPVGFVLPGAGAPAVVATGSGEHLSPNWVQASPAQAPPALVGAVMAFDPVRDQTVLFGGIKTGGVYSAETWVWNGSTWAKLTPATSPSARAAASMAWDPVAQKVFLFGGQTSASVAVNDVWAWNGTTWALQTTTGGPPVARSEAAMAYDPVREGMVVFGGLAGSGLRNDTWMLKSNVWAQIQAQGAAGAPAVRAAPALVYSQSTSQLLLFGGGNFACPGVCTAYDDTWILGSASSSWSAQSPTHKPTARGGAAVTYDPGMGSVVLFGGTAVSGGSQVVLNDTWAWTGSDWSRAAGIASPSGRTLAAMAADDEGQVVMFGGANATILGETWTYDTSLPVLTISVTGASGGSAEAPVFWVGDSAQVAITAVNAGVNAITTTSGTAITSALQGTALAGGSLVKFDGTTVAPCAGAGGVLCGGVQDLTASVANIAIPAGGTRVTDFVATVAGSQRGCELVDIPAIASQLSGASASVSTKMTVCGGGLGLEKWWTYDTTDLGDGGSANVNVANGNLVVKQYDTNPIQTRGRLALGLGRAYNSQDLLSGGGPLGAGWQFDIGDAGGTAGAFGIAGLKLPNLQTLTQPLSMPYVDRDGTRHVFKLRSVGANGVGIDLTSQDGIADSVLGLLDKDTLPFALTSTAEDLTYGRLCIDQTYTGPAGSNMFLFRYVGTNAGSCGNPASDGGVALGWSMIRPDRVRYDFNLAGDLIQVTDPSGQQLIYTPGVTYGPTKISTKACGSSGACPRITIDYDVGGAPAGHRHVKVTDTAGRVISYLVTTDALMPQLAQVWEAGNPLSDNPAAKPSINYTYSTAAGGCPGSAPDAATVGQLCSVTDALGNVTKFTYAKAPLGPDRIASVTDRRGTVAADGASKGLATRYTFHDPDSTQNVPDWVVADQGSPDQVAACGSVCQRIRYQGIDAFGRVGVIEEGTSGDVYLHQTGFFWDGGAIGSCSQPTPVVNHNLCQTIRRAVPSNDLFVPGGASTGTIDGVTVHDQAVDNQYSDLGQLLRRRTLLDAAEAFTDANAAVTTWGTHDQYFDADGSQRAFDNTPRGNGRVVSSAAGANYRSAVLRDDPLAYWRLGEAPGVTTAASETGVLNATYAVATTRGAAGAVQGNTAVTEPSASFGASVASMTGFASGTTAGSSDFTVEAWERTTDTTAQEAAFQWGSSSNQYASIGRLAGGYPMFYLASDVATNKRAIAYSPVSISDGNWHHLVWTYDGSGTTAGMAIWVDGVKVPLYTYSNTLAGAFAPATTTGQFAKAGPNSTLDELAIYPKVLSDARIAAHRDAALSGQRVETNTLYAVSDPTQELSPRGNASSNAGSWGDYLTTYRIDVPADGQIASTNSAGDTTICGGATRGNTGLVCEVDTPASAGVPAGVCASPVTGLPFGTAPTSAGYTHSCTTYQYNAAGQKTRMRTPKANAASSPDAFEYRYYDDTETCAGAGRAHCDLTGTVSAGGWLKAVIDPAGEKVLYAYDAAGNPARTWDRNATHNKSLDAPWSDPTAAPSTAFTEKVNATPVTSEALSVSNTALVTVAPDGTVFGSGTNASRELGDGTTTARPNPVTATGLDNVVQVAQSSTGAFSGCSWSLFLTGSGTVWTSTAATTKPGKVAGLSDIISVAAGGCHALALDAKGQLFAWGSGGYGQIGNGGTSSVTTPVKVLDNVATVGAGYLHSLAVKTDGSVWAWGRNTEGQLGLGDTTQRTSPTQVTAFSGARALSGGVTASYAITRDGNVWSWGGNASGDLGLGDTTARTSPTRITTLGADTAAGRVKEIVGSLYGAAALMADGKVRAWGYNTSGQLGGASPSGAVSTPTTIPGLTGQSALAGGVRWSV